MRIRRVLLATINYDHPQTGMIRAFEYVFGKKNVLDFDYLQQGREGLSLERINADFVYTATSFQPDWIWLQVQETNIISAETLKLIKVVLPNTIITHWTGDYRPEISPYLASICEATDVTFISSTGQIPQFKAAGAKNVFYLQIGIDWEEDVLGIPSWEPPFRIPSVVFIGNYYGSMFPQGTSERLAVVRAMQEANIDFGVVGSGWPSDVNVVGRCGVKQQHHVYKKAQLALSINHINDVDNYYSDRQLIAMASGTPVLAKFVPGLSDEFDLYGTRVECLYFDTPSEAVETTKTILQKPDLLANIGYHGRRAIMRNHDWRNRVLDAIDIFEDLFEE